MPGGESNESLERADALGPVFLMGGVLRIVELVAELRGVRVP